MKKIVVNVPDTLFEKYRFEAIEEEKSVEQVLKAWINSKPFSETVEEAFQDFMEQSLRKLTEGV
jgi:hypothetical protein